MRRLTIFSLLIPLAGIAGCHRSSPKKGTDEGAANNRPTGKPDLVMRPSGMKRAQPPPRPRRRVFAFIPHAALAKQILAFAKKCPKDKSGRSCAATQMLASWIKSQPALMCSEPTGPRIRALRTIMHHLGHKDPAVRAVAAEMLRTNPLDLFNELDCQFNAISAADLRILMGSLPLLAEDDRNGVVSWLASLAPLQRMSDAALQAVVAAYGKKGLEINVFLWEVLRFNRAKSFDEKGALALVDRQIPPDPFASGYALMRFDAVIKARATMLERRTFAERQPHCAWLAKVLPPKVPRHVTGFILGTDIGTTIGSFVSACRAIELIPYLQKLRKRIRNRMLARYVGLVFKKRPIWHAMNQLATKRAALVSQRTQDPAKKAVANRRIASIDKLLKSYEGRLDRLDKKFMSGAF